jgi:hypothetical protein
MLQLCSYETHALGYSAFCDLFSEVITSSLQALTY